MPPRSAGVPAGAAAGREAGTGSGARSGTSAARGSCSSFCEVDPPGRRLRRRREVPAARSGLAAGAGGAAMGGGSGRTPFALGLRLRRREGLAAGAAAAAGAGARTLEEALAASRLTRAPISPSAQRAPSVVWTSTRQTTIDEGDPATGGRFWVRTHRAYSVSPAWIERGKRQFSHSHSAISGTGVSTVPRPTAIATTRDGGAVRGPWSASMVSGDRSPETPAKSAMSASETVRRRVVHSPPRGRSSKESGSRSARV